MKTKIITIITGLSLILSFSAQGQEKVPVEFFGVDIPKYFARPELKDKFAGVGTYIKKGRYKDAIAELEMLCKQYKDDQDVIVWAKYSISLVKMKMLSFEDAITSFEECIKIANNDKTRYGVIIAQCYLPIGNINLFILKDYKTAANYYKRVIKEYPYGEICAQAMLDLSLCYFINKQYSDASKQLEEVLNKYAENSAIMSKATSLEKLFIQKGIKIKNKKTKSSEKQARKCEVCDQIISDRGLYVILLKEGAKKETCCAHCGVWLQLSLGDKVEKAIATDAKTKKPVDPNAALYLINAKSSETECPVAIITIANHKLAEKTHQELGGELLAFNQLKSRPDLLYKKSVSHKDENRLKETRDRLPRAAQELENAKRRVGNYPMSLEKLKKWFNDKPRRFAKFLDPYNPGHDFGYSARGDEWILWSIGPDGTDDSGELIYEEEAGKKGKGDIVLTKQGYYDWLEKARDMTVEKEWKDAYKCIQEAKKLRYEGRNEDAIERYRKAFGSLRFISDVRPQWNPKVVKTKMEECNREVIEIGGSNLYEEKEEKKSVKKSRYVLKERRININTASVEELKKVPGCGAKRATRIVAYREEHGRFKSIDDLKKIEGIGNNWVTLNKKYLTVENRKKEKETIKKTHPTKNKRSGLSDNFSNDLIQLTSIVGNYSKYVCGSRKNSANGCGSKSASQTGRIKTCGSGSKSSVQSGKTSGCGSAYTGEVASVKSTGMNKARRSCVCGSKKK